jgi:2-oxoisovalerate dehydrogenase E1 component
MYKTLKPLIETMRHGGGPLLVEAHVVRLDSHSSSDDQAKYRTEEELEAVRRQDPIAHTSGRVMSWGLIDESSLKAMREAIKDEVGAAADEADGAPDPQPETAAQHIFSGVSPVDAEREPKPISTAPITMIDALNHALREEMERNPKIVMWGEDIADPKGGVFGVTEA